MKCFKGRDETIHLENGHSFGIPPNIYQMLAQAAISASELAGIERALIEARRASSQARSTTCTASNTSFRSRLSALMFRPSLFSRRLD